MPRVIEAMDLEVVLEAHAEVAESPVWDADRGRLVWVDIPLGVVHYLDPTTGRDEPLGVGQPVGAVALRSTGGLVLALRDGFGLLEPDGDQVRVVDRVESARTGNRMNDGKCDAAGRFWAGTMALDETPSAGALYCLDTTLRARQVLGNLTMSNGIAWSLDGRTLYLVDTPTQGVDAFDFDMRAGAIANRRRLLDVPPEEGLPDGLTVDADGFLWLALWGGSAVRRYSPTGELDAIVLLPVSQVTSCTFGGVDLDVLYVTSAAAGLGPEDHRSQPHAGAIFEVRPGVRGLAPAMFGR